MAHAHNVYIRSMKWERKCYVTSLRYGMFRFTHGASWVQVAVLNVSDAQINRGWVTLGQNLWRKELTDVSQILTRSTPWVKKGRHDTLVHIFANIGRFSQFFHRHTLLELCNKIINKDPTSPQMCCYTTLWNVPTRHWQCTAHRAHETIKLLQRETPAFISPDLWPPNSPDLNPVNCNICGVMQDRVYQKKSEGRERVERVTGWGLGRTATERDWRCHRPVAQTPACLYSG